MWGLPWERRSLTSFTAVGSQFLLGCSSHHLKPAWPKARYDESVDPATSGNSSRKKAGLWLTFDGQHSFGSSWCDRGHHSLLFPCSGSGVGVGVGGEACGTSFELLRPITVCLFSTVRVLFCCSGCNGPHTLIKFFLSSYSCTVFGWWQTLWERWKLRCLFQWDCCLHVSDVFAHVGTWAQE